MQTKEQLLGQIQILEDRLNSNEDMSYADRFDLQYQLQGAYGDLELLEPTECGCDECSDEDIFNDPAHRAMFAMFMGQQMLDNPENYGLV